MPDRSEQVFAAIRDLLTREGASFEVRDHEPVRTSEEAAAARGEPLAIGGKSLVIKVDDAFRVFVVSAARKLDSRAIKRRFGTQYTRFATAEELDRLVGVKPGSVPPFGRPVLPLPLYLDTSIAENDRVAFNAGLRTRSIVMPVADYLRVARPEEVFSFSRAAV